MMFAIITFVVLLFAFFGYACMNLSSKCSRNEEKKQLAEFMKKYNEKHNTT